MANKIIEVPVNEFNNMKFERTENAKSFERVAWDIKSNRQKVTIFYQTGKCTQEMLDTMRKYHKAGMPSRRGFISAAQKAKRAILAKAS